MACFSLGNHKNLKTPHLPQKGTLFIVFWLLNDSVNEKKERNGFEGHHHVNMSSQLKHGDHCKGIADINKQVYKKYWFGEEFVL